MAQMAYADKTRLWVMVIAANALIPLAFLLGFRFIREWRYDKDSDLVDWARWGRRLHVGVVTLACFGLLVVLGFFNLLGLNMPG